MNWIPFENEDQLNHIIAASAHQPQIIFKHSTRCIISSMAKERIEKYAENNFIFHYLNLIQYRNLSNMVAEKFNIQHQSPQILIIKSATCVFDESHGGINIADLKGFCN